MFRSPFHRIELQALDVDGARTFYTAVAPGVLPTSLIPPEARARGAPAHWLGVLLVDDVDGSARNLEAAGASRLGPTRTTHDGPLARLRDPGGAVFALAGAKTPPRSPSVGAIVLHTPTPRATICFYQDHFGWSTGDVEPTPMGPVRVLTRPEGARVAFVVEITDAGATHPHWLFFLEVDDVALAAKRATDLGATSIRLIEVAPTVQAAVLDDPQGAAVGLWPRGFAG